MPLGVEVGLSPGDFVLEGDPDPYPKRGGAPPNFWPTSVVAKRLHGSIKMPLGTEVGLCLRDIVFDVDPAIPQKKGTPTPPNFCHVYCGQMAGWMKTPPGAEVGLGTGHIVLDGVPAPAKGAQQPPLFGPCLLWPRSPISATAELLYIILDIQNTLANTLVTYFYNIKIADFGANDYRLICHRLNIPTGVVTIVTLSTIFLILLCKCTHNHITLSKYIKILWNMVDIWIAATDTG